ncbi:MAG TPA: hypothetical protein PLA65_20215, partial [Spirochaetota bacterium]|nr:hypothetical protein [Spirochaetota bacterium]
MIELLIRHITRALAGWIELFAGATGIFTAPIIAGPVPAVFAYKRPGLGDDGRLFPPQPGS